MAFFTEIGLERRNLDVPGALPRVHGLADRFREALAAKAEARRERCVAAVSALRDAALGRHLPPADAPPPSPPPLELPPLRPLPEYRTASGAVIGGTRSPLALAGPHCRSFGALGGGYDVTSAAERLGAYGWPSSPPRRALPRGLARSASQPAVIRQCVLSELQSSDTWTRRQQGSSATANAATALAPAPAAASPGAVELSPKASERQAAPTVGLMPFEAPSASAACAAVPQPWAPHQPRRSRRAEAERRARLQRASAAQH
eukprot:TRINITY_DN56561_c0_g1_i1.p1 TRINITY_DN56561_c0_g1~~TRINITY_DN56561_c0_g1_i1.p1  ORF type:complete len:261 (+),score=48.13 TRINITY_DN56561_c0_g1_i1:131-913(+)